MSVREFMARVVPWPEPHEPGVINLHWFTAKQKLDGKRFFAGRPFRELNQFASMVAWGVNNPQYVRDVYFCLSRQAQPGPLRNGKFTAMRGAQNADALKAIWLDIDIKPNSEHYATLEDALAGLQEFLQLTGLPPPSAMVNSGSPGLHVYWISTKAMDVAEWRPYAEGLKALAIQHSLKCDASLTTDVVRVLRVPGTHNFKTDPPKNVVLLGLGQDYDYGSSPLQRLAAIQPAAPTPLPAAALPALTFDMSAFPKREHTNPSDSLGTGIEPPEMPPLPPRAIFKGCPLYGDALVNHGADHKQPLWHLLVMGTTFMEEGRALAHEISKGHPGYTEESTNAMFDRKVADQENKNLGWPSCKALCDAGSKFCQGCPLFGKIKSPLNLAVGDTESVRTAPVPAGVAAQLDDLFLPEGYVLDKSGIINKDIEKTGLDGETHHIFKPLFYGKVEHPFVSREPGATLNFSIDMGRGRMVPVCMPMDKLGNTTNTLNMFCEQSVTLPMENREHIGAFIMAWINKLREARDSIEAHPFGWYEANGDRHGFVYNGRIMFDNGTEQLANIADPGVRRAYTPRGEIGPWFEALKIITDQHRPDLEAIVAAAFAGPLMVSSGEYNGLFSAWGDTGVGKSTAMKIALAVWGNPKTTKEVPDSTHKSVIKKMGDLRHIPIFWDEIKDEETQKNIYNVVFSGSEGVAPSRLTADIKSRDRTDWQTIMVTCSNVSFVDYILRRQRTHGAGIARVLEYHVANIKDDKYRSFEVARIVQKLENNYGQIGLKYAKLLAATPADIDKLTVKEFENVCDRVSAQQHERFWVACAATATVGAALANVLGASFNVSELREFLIEQLLAMRERLTAEGVHSETGEVAVDAMTRFLRAHSDRTLWTDIIPLGKGKPQKVILLNSPSMTNPKGMVIQFGKEDRLLRFSKAEFVEWMVAHTYSPHSILSSLRKYHGSTTVRGSIGAGTPFRVGQERLIEITVKEGSPFEPLLYAYSNGEEPAAAAEQTDQ